MLFDSALEAIREHPGVYFRGVADTFWEFLRQKPLRENVAPREQTAPEAPAPTFESDGDVLPNPQATVLARRRAVRLRLVRVRLHRLVHARGSRRRSGATRRRRSGIGRSSRRSGRGTPSSRRGRAWTAVPEILNRITPRYPDAGALARGRRRRARRGGVRAAGARSCSSGRRRSSSCSSTPPRRASLPSSRCRCTRLHRDRARRACR